MKDYLYVLFRNSIAGFNSVVLKVLTSTFSIFYLILFRQIIIFLTTLIFFDLRKIYAEYKALPKADVYKIIISTMLSTSAVYTVFSAYQYIPITLFALLEQSLALLCSLFFAKLFLKERLNPKIYLVVVIMLVGLVLVVTNLNFSDLGSISWLGLFLLLSHGVLFAISGVVSVSPIKKLSTSSFTFMSTLVRLILVIPIPFILGVDLSEFIDKLDVKLILLVVYGAVTILIIDFLFSSSIKSIGFSKTQLFIPMIPIISTISAMLVFKQYLSFVQWIGIIIVAISLFMIVTLRDDN